jgi:MFS family permease
MLLWMGFVKTLPELLASRIMLGIFEAGLFPGVNYYLSCWYKRNEFGLRAAIFFSAAAVIPSSLLYSHTIARREFRWFPRCGMASSDER